MIINIRGANGSGKTTIARHFLRPEDNLKAVELGMNPAPRKQPAYVQGTVNVDREVCVVGPYKTACGGMDALPNFAVCFSAIREASKMSRNVLCEGVLASTVFGSWADFAKEMNTTTIFAFAYLQTPLAECLRRIQVRNGGKPIKEDLVKSKINAIAATRKKALAAGFVVYDIPYQPEIDPAAVVGDILLGRGEQYRGR